MRILLTGGTGFIGRNLQEYLSMKYDVVAPTHTDLNLLNGESVSSFFSNSPWFNVVIHAAVRGGRRTDPNTKEVLDNNLLMFHNIAQAHNLYGRLIFFGSGAEYDKSRDITNIKESEFGKSVPKDFYGLYKYRCSEFIRDDPSDSVSLRLFGVYGKYEDYTTRFISNAICRSILGLPIVIENRNAYFDYLYIKDLCRIVEHFACHKPKHRFYNVGKGERIDLYTLAKKVREISGNKEEIVVRNAGLSNEYTCDISLLKEEIPDFGFTDHDSAIRELYHWYDDNMDNVDWRKLK